MELVTSFRISIIRHFIDSNFIGGKIRSRIALMKNVKVKTLVNCESAKVELERYNKKESRKIAYLLPCGCVYKAMAPIENIP